MKRARPKNKDKLEHERLYILALVALMCVSAILICVNLFWKNNKAEPAESGANRLTESIESEPDVDENPPEIEETGLTDEYFSHIYSID